MSCGAFSFSDRARCVVQRPDHTTGKVIGMTRLEFHRRRKKWTQQQLGDLTGILQGYISQFERGMMPGPGQRERLARALDVDPDRLLDQIDDVILNEETARA